MADLKTTSATLNNEKWQTYQEIKLSLFHLMGVCEAVQQVKADPAPDPAEDSAHITATVSGLSVFKGESASILAGVITKADCFSINGIGGSVRLSFTVAGIWNK